MSCCLWKQGHGNPYPVAILAVVRFVLSAPISTVAGCSRPPPSLLTVAGPRGAAVRRAYPALGSDPVPASIPAPRAEVCGSYVYRQVAGLHRPHHGPLVLDDQRVVRLASRKAVSQLCEARLECSGRRASEDR